MFTSFSQLYENIRKSVLMIISTVLYIYSISKLYTEITDILYIIAVSLFPCYILIIRLNKFVKEQMKELEKEYKGSQMK